MTKYVVGNIICEAFNDFEKTFSNGGLLHKAPKQSDKNRFH